MQDRRGEGVTREHGEGEKRVMLFSCRGSGLQTCVYPYTIKLQDGIRTYASLPPLSFILYGTIGLGLVLPPIQCTSRPAVKYRILPLVDRFQLIQRFAS
jgi:hypothetical protein